MRQKIWVIAALLLLVVAGLAVYLSLRSGVPRQTLAARKLVIQPPLSSLSLPKPDLNAKAVTPSAESAAAATEPHSYQEMLAAAKVLETRETPHDANGQFERLEIIQADYRRPFLRVDTQMGSFPLRNREWPRSQLVMVADDILVGLKPGASEKALQELNSKFNATIADHISDGVYLIQLPSHDLDAVPRAIQNYSKAAGMIAYAEPNYLVHSSVTIPNDPQFGAMYQLRNTGQTGGTPGADIQAADAWDITTGSNTILVGVIDSGVDWKHPDLAGNIWVNPGEIAGNNKDDDANGFKDDVRGWDFVDNDNDPNDEFFHGTHVAGTIGAVGNNAKGVVGVNWTVKIVPIRFLDKTGSGDNANAIKAINYATKIHCNLTCNSWGGGGFSQALKDSIDAAAAKGIFFIAAAGNEGANVDLDPHFPSSYTSSNIISVAATDFKDHVASFSNFGVTNAHVAAPGVAIISTTPHISTAAMTADGVPANYGSLDGTSMATPHVAGVVALLLAQNGSYTMPQVRSRILDRAVPIQGLIGKTMLNSRLNAFNALNNGWVAGPAAMVTTQVGVDDPAGNADHIANPNETVQFKPTIYNWGQTTANALTVQLSTVSPNANVLTAAPVAMANLAPGKRAVPVTPYDVQLGAALTNDSSVPFQFAVFQGGVLINAIPYNEVVSVNQPTAETQATFTPAGIRADPTRNVVYVLNVSHHKIHAIDTTTGTVTASVDLLGKASGTANTLGQIDVSPDGSRLYVAEVLDKMVEVYSLPNLTHISTFTLGYFPIGLAVGANNRLYVSSFDGGVTEQIKQLDATTGVQINSFDRGPDGTFYYGTILRTNPARDRLYAVDSALYGGDDKVYEFDISGGGFPVLKRSFDFFTYLVGDLTVDDANQVLYVVNTGSDGVQAIDMNTGAVSLLPMKVGTSGGAAVVQRTGSPAVYAASADASASDIRKFSRFDGTTLVDVPVNSNTAATLPAGMAITANNVIIYVKQKSSGGSGSINGVSSYVGSIGLGSLTLPTLPAPPPPSGGGSGGSGSPKSVLGNGGTKANTGIIIYSGTGKRVIIRVGDGTNHLLRTDPVNVGVQDAFDVRKVNTPFADLFGSNLKGVAVGPSSSGLSRLAAAGVWQINGSGISSDTSDGFYFESSPQKGSFEAVARIQSLHSAGAAPMAGIMLRENLLPNSRYVFVGVDGSGRIETSWRSDLKGVSQSATGSPVSYPNVWVGMVRHGNWVAMYFSSDGQNWTQQGVTYVGNLAVTGQLGLAVTSGSPGVNAKADISDYFSAGVRDRALAIGAQHGMTIQDDGSVLAWGANDSGQLGIGSADPQASVVQVAGLGDAAGIAAGGAHSLAFRSDAAFRSWGANDGGQLGIGTTTNQWSPTAVTTVGKTPVQIAAGEKFSLAVRADGNLYAWGDNSFGQLGLGNLLPKLTATKVGIGQTKAVAAGPRHAVALKADGTVWAWGFNDAGQSGGVIGSNVLKPFQMKSLTGMSAVAAGAHHSAAVKSDGTVWCWGANDAGQLGDGSNTPSAVPVLVPGLTGVVAVAAGDDFTVALKSDGTVWAWGGDASGQMGDGGGANHLAPVQIATDDAAISVSAGGARAGALTADGLVVLWGGGEAVHELAGGGIHLGP